MLKSAATLEDRGELGLAAQPERPKMGPAVMRFAYATGSRPLDGYTIKRGVGVGGFGEVYFAVSDAGKEVAVKRIQRNLDIEIRGVTQCLNLKHHNLVAIYDIRYDDEGQAWVVMEYVRGESLKDTLDRNPNGMPQREVMDWFCGIASGVAYLHDHGIVHRDLKPGNVFLDEAVVKIGDYGLSKYISCSRRSGQTESVGTFHYMAPEIGRGIYGKEIDIYALGIMLYEMFTGRVPFEGESSHEIIMKHLTAAPDVTPLPEKLRPIVQRALFKDPEKRFRSVAEMSNAVEAVLGGTHRHTFMAAHTAASANATTSDPKVLYIGAETDGMYFGPVQQTVTAEPIPVSPIAAAASSEPIAEAVRGGWQQFAAWWKGPTLNRTPKILLAAFLITVMVVNAGWILPAAAILGSIYLVYFGIRMIVLSPEQKPLPAAPVATPFQPRPAPASMPPATFVAATAPVVASPAKAKANPAKTNPAKRRRRWHEVASEQLRRKTPGERLMELTGSMLMSSVVVGVVSFLVLLVAGHPVNGSVSTWSNFAWLGLTSLLGTWSVLVPAKMWEGVDGDIVRRRFLQVILGLGVGAAAFGLDLYLSPNLTHSPVIDTPTAWRLPQTIFESGRSPLLPGYLVYFAGLFVAMRWWQQANPMRTARFSIWSTLGTVILAVVWQIFWPFPQPWGLMVPAAMSIALQLSTPWIDNRTRSEMRKVAEVD
jgi:hypothetical protein